MNFTKDNLGAVRDRDETIIFWAQKVQVSGHSEIDHVWSDKHFWRQFLTRMRRLF